ncbi:MAG: hypothetical protein ACP5D2_04125, partial [Candidatus Nanoarchaeia archaeon]
TAMRLAEGVVNIAGIFGVEDLHVVDRDFIERYEKQKEVWVVPISNINDIGCDEILTIPA